MTSKGFLPVVGACFGLALLSRAGATADAVVPVSVHSEGATFTVKVSAPTPVRVVLQTLCERAEASCKLPAGMRDTLVPARTFRGSWPDVVAELLQNSGMSFGATPPAPGRSPYLMVEAPASVKPAPGPRSRPPVANAPPAPSETPATSADASPATAEEAPAEEAPAPDAAPEASATPVDPATATLVTAASAAAMPATAFAMTPFADAGGNPLMSRITTPPGAPVPNQAVLPYSDEAGNPLVVPITNEPLSLTPFAGPDGQAWPAPVPQPGQKLEYPIPPTPLTPPDKP